MTRLPPGEGIESAPGSFQVSEDLPVTFVFAQPLQEGVLLCGAQSAIASSQPVASLDSDCVVLLGR